MGIRRTASGGNSEGRGGPELSRLLVVTTDPEVRARLEVDGTPDGATFVASVEEAVGVLADVAPEAVVVDVCAHGTGALEDLAAAAPDLALVALTDGRDAGALVLQALDAGADEHVDKDGMDPAALAGALRRALVRRGARSAHEADAVAPEATLLDALPAAVVATDADGTVVYWNPEAARVFGLGPHDALGRSVAELSVWPAAPGRGAVHDGPLDERWGGAHEVVRPDGTTVAVGTTITRIDEHESGFFGLVGVSVDRSGPREVAPDAAYRALHDQLTGLPNRELFFDHVSRAIARDSRNNRHTAVLVADLDDFETLNEVLGRAHGDVVLRTVASRLVQAVRDGDLVARVGGDEFAICCEDVGDRAEALAAGERMAKALAGPTGGPGDPGGVSASIGVAIGDVEAEPEMLLRQATLAMSVGKGHGKSRVEVFDESFSNGHVLRADEMATDLGRAVADGNIEVDYQPVYVLDDGSLYGFEALARWTHPEWGPIRPNEFIRAAELSGTIGELGAQVLETACATLADWLSMYSGRHLRMTVNVSALQLSDPTFPDLVEDVVERTGIPAGALCVELTESALVAGDATGAALRRLKEIGVETSIDDFGSEYASLSRLHEFPIDYLKIDRGVVGGMTNRPVDAAIVDALLGLARSLGIWTVAKGVENVAQLAALQSAGCQLGQGFFWSKPLPTHEATSLYVATAR